MDLEKRYENLCKAIEAIENGAQSYNIDGQSVTKASLATLYSQLRQANGGDLYIVDVADRG